MNDRGEPSAARGERPARDAGQNGPPLLLPAAHLLILTAASIALGVTGPRPGDDAARIARYDVTHHGTLCALALVVSATSIPVAIWAAVVRHRLRRLGVSAPGVSMAFAGGILAAAAISGSGIATWVAAESAGQSEPSLSRALLLLAFGLGGPGYVVPCALLVAGVAVPALILGLLPRALARSDSSLPHSVCARPSHWCRARCIRCCRSGGSGCSPGSWS